MENKIENMGTRVSGRNKRPTEKAQGSEFNMLIKPIISEVVQKTVSDDETEMEASQLVNIEWSQNKTESDDDDQLLGASQPSNDGKIGETTPQNVSTEFKEIKYDDEEYIACSLCRDPLYIENVLILQSSSYVKKMMDKSGGKWTCKKCCEENTKMQNNLKKAEREIRELKRALDVVNEERKKEVREKIILEERNIMLDAIVKDNPNNKSKENEMTTGPKEPQKSIYENVDEDEEDEEYKDIAVNGTIPSKGPIKVENEREKRENMIKEEVKNEHCKFFMHGYCRYRESCWRKHYTIEDHRKTIKCRFYEQGNCNKREWCGFKHEKKTPCKYEARGGCKRKDICEFTHMNKQITKTPNPVSTDKQPKENTQEKEEIQKETFQKEPVIIDMKELRQMITEVVKEVTKEQQ